MAEIVIGELGLEGVAPEKLDPDMDLVSEVGADSIDLAAIAVVLQKKYDIVIDEADSCRLRTVRRIGACVAERLASKH